MIKVENIETWGFEHAMRAMRNPMNSWDKSDSKFFNDYDNGIRDVILGENDLDLMKRLYKAGEEHRIYARMIKASMDITAPLYWWKEMDRYCVGKDQISCSTMHTIARENLHLKILVQSIYLMMKHIVMSVPLQIMITTFVISILWI